MWKDSSNKNKVIGSYSFVSELRMSSGTGVVYFWLLVLRNKGDCYKLYWKSTGLFRSSGFDTSNFTGGIVFFFSGNFFLCLYCVSDCAVYIRLVEIR